MTSILGRIFGTHAEGDRSSYHEAMRVSGDLLTRMRNDSAKSTDAARAIMADVWAQNRNMPFLTTVYEAVQEVKAGGKADG